MEMLEVSDTQREVAEWRAGGGLVIPVVSAIREKRASGEAMLERWSARQRFWRAARMFAVMVLLTVASALVPILHFVLVPLFVILTLVLPSVAYAKSQRIRGGIAMCPECHHHFPLMAGVSRLPFQDHCTACQRTLTISADSTTSE